MNLSVPEHLMKNLKKLQVVYSDVDGTFVTEGCLFRNRSGYTLQNARAIYNLLSAGVDIVMTSGREKEKLADTARLLGLQNYIANLGIEIVYRQGEQVITNPGIGLEDPKELKSWIQKSGVSESLFQNFPGKLQFYLPWSRILRTHLLFIGEIDLTKAIRLIEKDFPELRIIDNGRVAPYDHFTTPHAYHVLPRKVGKRSAVQIDKKERGLKTENLIAIGDSMEDATLAEEVALFFLLDAEIPVLQPNVVPLNNHDGEAFSRIVDFLKAHHLF